MQRPSKYMSRGYWGVRHDPWLRIKGPCKGAHNLFILLVVVLGSYVMFGKRHHLPEACWICWPRQLLVSAAPCEPRTRVWRPQRPQPLQGWSALRHRCWFLPQRGGFRQIARFFRILWAEYYNIFLDSSVLSLYMIDQWSRAVLNFWHRKHVELIATNL